MTVQRLRERGGDHDFFRILRRWPEVRAGRTGSTPQFVRLAERISGERLGGLFHAWLYTSHKPAVPHAGRPPARTSPSVGAALHRLGAAGLVR